MERSGGYDLLFPFSNATGAGGLCPLTALGPASFATRAVRRMYSLFMRSRTSSVNLDTSSQFSVSIGGITVTRTLPAGKRKKIVQEGDLYAD